jgi:NitT/TauT family transport system substrate-binding protein
VTPLNNGYTLIAFKRKQVDAAWVPEPWATRLVKETGAVRVIDERDLWPGGKFTTTVVAVRPAFLKDHPDVVAAFVKANDDAVDWINQHPADAMTIVNNQLAVMAGKPLAAGVIQESWKRLTFTTDPDLASIKAQATAAQAAGYLKEVSAPWESLVLPKANAPTP